MRNGENKHYLSKIDYHFFPGPYWLGLVFPLNITFPTDLAISLHLWVNISNSQFLQRYNKVFKAAYIENSNMYNNK